MQHMVDWDTHKIVFFTRLHDGTDEEADDDMIHTYEEDLNSDWAEAEKRAATYFHGLREALIKHGHIRILRNGGC